VNRIFNITGKYCNVIIGNVRPQLELIFPLQYGYGIGAQYNNQLFYCLRCCHAILPAPQGSMIIPDHAWPLPNILLSECSRRRLALDPWAHPDWLYHSENHTPPLTDNQSRWHDISLSQHPPP
jgi:hypothetical protein